MGTKDTSNNRAVLDALKGLQEKIRVLEVLMLPGKLSKIPPIYGSVYGISLDIFVLTAVDLIMVDVPLLSLWHLFTGCYKEGGYPIRRSAQVLYDRMGCP